MTDARTRAIAARRICEGRSLRRENFPEEIFSDAPWGMLLWTYVAAQEGRKLDVDEVCSAVHVTRGVGERWLRYLGKEGLVEREDGRCLLTGSASSRIDEHLDRMIDLAARQEDGPSSSEHVA